MSALRGWTAGVWETEIWWELEVEWDALEIDTGDGNLRRTSSEWVGWFSNPRWVHAAVSYYVLFRCDGRPSGIYIAISETDVGIKRT